MTTKQPEAQHYALELADTLGKRAGTSMAATTLRTQHALLERARDALRHSNPSEPIWKTPHRETLAAITQHLEPK